MAGPLEAALAKARAGDLPVAEDQLNRLASEHPDDPRPPAVLVGVRYRRGDLLGAMDACLASLRIRSTTPAWNGLALMHFDRGEDEHAVQALNQSLAIDLRQEECWVYLARIHARRGLHARSEELYRRALEYSPGDLAILEEYSLDMLVHGETAAARRVAEDLLRRYPDNGIGRLVLGRVHFTEGDPAAAVAVLPSTTHEIGDPGVFHLFWGDALLALRRYEEAETHLLASLRYPKNAKAAHYALARLYRERKRPEEAKQHTAEFRRLQTAEEAVTEAAEFSTRAEQQYARGDFAGAIAVLREGLAAYPNSSDMRLQLAYCQIMSPTEALDWDNLAHGERLCPFNPKHYSNLGVAFYSTGNTPLARRCWAKCVLLDASLQPPLENLARLELRETVALLRAAGIGEQEVQRLVQVVAGVASGTVMAASEEVTSLCGQSETPLRRAACVNLALALALRGENSRSLAFLADAAASERDSPEIETYRCIVLMRAGEAEEANRIATKLGFSWTDLLFLQE